jgi:hypothetical protein
MPSPFPGMDPYIEASSIWADFHTRLVSETRNVLNARLPDRYIAAIDLHVWLHEPSAEERTLVGRPDAFVADTAPPRPNRTVTAPETYILPASRRQGAKFVTILDNEQREVVSVVQLLSPSNKSASPDRDQYLLKRNEYIAKGVNLLEIDLLRRGQRMPLSEPAPPPSDYVFALFRAADWPRFGVWRLGLRDPLPILPVPLRTGEPDVEVPLADCFTRVYDNARLDRRLNYQSAIVPALSDADAAWARELIAARAR